MQTFYLIDVKDKAAFLKAIFSKFPSEKNFLSLEGNFQCFDFIENKSTFETPILQRQTLSPLLDFVVFPLTKQNTQKFCHDLILNPLFLEERIIHLQIENQGKLLLGAYDYFAPECTILSTLVSYDFLNLLKNQDIIKSYKIQ